MVPRVARRSDHALGLDQHGLVLEVLAEPLHMLIADLVRDPRHRLAESEKAAQVTLQAQRQ
jgi:hypothetical protein